MARASAFGCVKTVEFSPHRVVRSPTHSATEKHFSTSAAIVGVILLRILFEKAHSFGAIKKKLVHFPDRECVGATVKAHQHSSHVISRENRLVRNGEKSTSVKIKKERKQLFSLLAPFAASATQFASMHT